MAMLAEKKRKQKWSLNPRGKEWSQDCNKFGQKMLEKMGWQTGKGLGAKENGITEHVKITYKNDSKGMGYKESNDQWTEHETNFSALLESLTGGESNYEEKKISSLEQKSQTSRARVHYHKFTRGKDLSRYSEKDLANIFGRKNLKQSKKQEEVKKIDCDSQENKTTNEFLVNAGSMRDYFKNKLSNFGKSNGYTIGNNGVLQKQNSESESDSKPAFGFGFRSENNSDSETEVKATLGFGFNAKDISSKKNTKKIPNLSKLKNETSFVSFVSKTHGKRAAEENDDEVISPIKKIKKEKIKAEKNTEGISNPAFNTMATPVKVENNLTTIEENLNEEQDESANKIKNKTSFVSYVSETHGKSAAEENDDEVISPKKKIKKEKIKTEKNTEGISNPAFNTMATPVKVENNLTTIEENLNEEQDESANKKKNKSVTTNGTPNLSKLKNETSFVSFVSKTHGKSAAEENDDEVISPKKKIKKEKLKIEGNVEGISNPAFNPMATPVKVEKHTLTTIEENLNEELDESTNNKKKRTVTENVANSFENVSIDSEESPKKKRKHNKEAFRNKTVDETNIDLSRDKIKKINKKHIELELVNPNFTETDEMSINSSQIDENPYEVKIKKKKSKKMEMDNPIFDDTKNNSLDTVEAEENPYEVKPNEKKNKKKKKKLALDNPCFEDQLEMPMESINPYEVKPKKKKKNKVNGDSGIVNPALDLNDSKKEDSTILSDCDLILNIISTPVRNDERSVDSIESANKSVKSRKSVRFSNVNQEMIIPNNAELKKLYGKKEKKKNKGIDNINFDRQKTNLEENVDTISKTLDAIQAEIENDINEEKIKTFTSEDFMVGEVGNPDGEDEKLEEGTKLKFKYANLDSKTPFYMMDKVGAKKSYKHLIKGDILLQFKNTNLHEISGYAYKRKNIV